MAVANAGYRVIAPDLRGRGSSWSPLEIANYTLDKLQKDVLDIMDTLKIEKAHLVGHDWGAVMGWNLAGMHADRFYTNTVVSIGHFSSPAFEGYKEKASSWYIYLFLQEGLAEQTLASYDWAFFRDIAFNRKNIDDMLERLTGPNQLTTALKATGQICKTGWRNLTPNILLKMNHQFNLKSKSRHFRF